MVEEPRPSGDFAAERSRLADAHQAHVHEREVRVHEREVHVHERDADADDRDRLAVRRDSASERRAVEEARLDHSFESKATSDARSHHADRLDSAHLRERSAHDRVLAAADLEQERAELIRATRGPESAVSIRRAFAAHTRDAAADTRDAVRDERDIDSAMRDEALSRTVDRYFGRLPTTRDQGAELLESQRDALTGMPSRHQMNQRLAQIFVNPSPQRPTAVLMFIDIDHFKKINDQFGHSVGDKVLKHVGARLVDTVSSLDLVARIGGDEFVVITDDAQTLPAALKLAELLRSAAAEPISIDPKTQATIRVSIGVADATDCFDGLQMLRNADAALYEAKNTGRDRCVLFTPETSAVANTVR